MSEEVAATLEVDAPEQGELKQDAGEEKPKADEKPAEAPKEGDGETAGAAADGEAEPPVKEKPQEEEKPQQSDPEEPQDDVPIVLVTGASGYMASHIVQQLLQDGRFRVRGTVRSLNNEQKVKFLRELVPEAKYPLRLIEADLLKPKTWIEAVRRCRFVFHVASPLMSKAKNPDVYIKPAVDGTTSVLKACVEAGTVKRVVVTSSSAAVSGLTGDPSKPADHVYTEADFADEETGTPYERSKVKAEKAAWDFVKGLEKDKQFELVTVCPGLLEGPIFAPAHKEGSVKVLHRIMAGKMSRLPDIYFAVTDVRDCAKAHIAAMEKAEAAGNRYLSFTETMHLKEVAQVVADEFKPQGYKIGVKNLPKAAMWAAKLVNSDAKVMYTMLGKKLDYSNEKMKGELGVEPRPAKETLIDTGYSMVEMGIIPKKPGYLGHPSTRPPPPEPAAAAEGDAPPQEASSAEPAKTTEEPPSDQTKAKEPAAKAEEPAKTEEPPKTEEPKAQEPATEEPPVKAEDTPSQEPAQVEEAPPSQEPAKVEETESQEPAKVEETPSEEPAKVEETPEEPAKEEEPPAEEPAATPSEEPAKEEEPASEPPKEEPDEATPTQEPETQESETKEEPSTEEMTTQDDEPPSEPAQGEDPPTEPTNEEPSASDPPAQEEQKESEPQETPGTTEDQQQEAATDADTES